MLGSLLFITSLYASTSLANPLAILSPRQLNPSQSSSCSATYYGSCTNTAQRSSATVWCASLGYGTSIVSVTVPGSGTTTIRKTLISTVTSFTATTIKTAPTSTTTSPVTKITTLTSISTLKVTQTTSTATVNAAGTLPSCETYTATYLPISTPTSTQSTGTTLTTTTTTSSGSSYTPTVHPTVAYSGYSSCPHDNLTSLTYQYSTPNQTSFQVWCGSDLRPAGYIPNYDPGTYLPSVSRLQDCVAYCLFDLGDNCGGVTYLTGVDQAPIDGPRCYYRQLNVSNVVTQEIYPPDWDLQYDGSQDHQWYWTAVIRLNYNPAPPTTTPAPTTTLTSSTVTYPPATSIEPTYLPPCVSGDCGNYHSCPTDDRTTLGYSNYMGGISTFEVYCGMDLYEQIGSRTNYWNWAESLDTCIGSCMLQWPQQCAGVTFITEETYDNTLHIYQCFYRTFAGNPIPSSDTVPGGFTYDPSHPVKMVSALLVSQSGAFRRDEEIVYKGTNDNRAAVPYIKRDASPAPIARSLNERQAVAKPACLKAPSSTATSSACKCVIPSPTTTRTTTLTQRVTISSTRTILTTKKTISTTTTTPVRTITKTVSTSTLLRTRTTTTTIKTATTVTTTGTWGLASTPTAFYIVDAHNGVAMWPADADEIFYNVQYDDSPDSDDPPPTVFALQGTDLIINDFVDQDIVVVGQPFNGTGAQVMALDRANAATPNFLRCAIAARPDGSCALSCTDPLSAGSRSWQDASGLWYLSPSSAAAGGIPFDPLVLEIP